MDIYKYIRGSVYFHVKISNLRSLTYRVRLQALIWVAYLPNSLRTELSSIYASGFKIDYYDVFNQVDIVLFMLEVIA